MGRARLGAIAVLAAIAPLGIAACGGSAPLGEADAKALLEELPYRFEFRKVEPPEGASGALAGTVYGPHGTYFHFGLALGRHPAGVPLAHSGDGDPSQDTGAGYTMTTDLMYKLGPGRWHYGRTIHTGAQWKESATMVVAIEEAICKAVTHEPCGV